MGNDEDFQFLARRCIWVNGPVVVGAGPTGLVVGYELRERGIPFILLEQANCIESLYDYLKLYLPKHFCQLPNFPFPDDFLEYPLKDQFTSYLESYASHFGIEPQFNEWVQLAKYDEAWRLWRINITFAGPNSGDKTRMEYICKWIVVITGERSADKVLSSSPCVLYVTSSQILFRESWSKIRF